MIKVIIECMNQKQIGTILIAVGVLLSVFVFIMKAREDASINLVIEERNSCYLDDGTCLHEDRNLVPFIIGWAVSAALVLFGVYLVFVDKTEQVLAEHQVKVSSALEAATKRENESSKFDAFLSGFGEDEQKVIKAVKEQEGILQSTLRFRTGISKSSLSLILKSLEGKNIVSRKVSGKTNQVFLRKKF